MPDAGVRRSLLEHPAWTRWGAHVGFWLMYLAIRTAAAGADPPEDVNDFPYLLNRGLVVFTYFLLTGILLAVIAGPRAARSNWARNLALVLGALALAPLTQYSEQFWPQRLAGFSPDPYPFVIYLFQFGWALPLWGLTQALLGYHFETMAQARAVTRAQALAYDAQLRMLHYQINPHFLFNTLNSVASLVRTDPDKARVVIHKLSNILRRLLRKTGNYASLRDELAFIDDYLSIEMVRFGDKLRFVKEVDAGTLDMMIPSMVLQPIVENSLKHGLASKVEGGTIRLTVRHYGGGVLLTIEDDGVGIPEANLAKLFEQGIGISNVNERLKVLFGTGYKMWIDSKPGEGTKTGIEIPTMTPGLAQAS